MPRSDTAARLRRFLATGPDAVPGYDADADARDHFELIDKEAKEAELVRQMRVHPSYADVPRFHRKADDNPLNTKWRAEARRQLLQRKSELMWDTTIMHMLWQLLLDHCYVEPGADKESGLIDYAIYDTVRQKLIVSWNAKARKEDDTHPIGTEPFLTARSFMRLPKDDQGRVPVLTFFNYMLKKVTLYQTRVELGVNDGTGEGYLTESELEGYFYDLIPTLPALAKLPEHFYPFYVCGAGRKFFFFLDPQHRGRIPIDAVMQSSVLSELLELQNASEEEECATNWFSATAAAKVYTHYVRLDADRNGMLSAAELAGYNDGALTALFVQRVFETSQTYNGEMDYKKYIEFVLAMENPASKPSFDFFWKILDINGDGLLTPFVVKLFYREVQAKLQENGFDPIKTEDVVMEVFDMVNPDTPMVVTRKDLERCRNRDTIILMLIDYKAFWRYDNRESLAAAQAVLPPSHPPATSPAPASGPVGAPRNLAAEIDDALA